MDLNARAQRLPDDTGEDIMALIDAVVDRTIGTLDPARMRADEMIATAMGHVIKLAIVSAQSRISALPGASAVDAVIMTSKVAAWHAGQATEALPSVLVAQALPQLGEALAKGARDACSCARCKARRNPGRPH